MAIATGVLVTGWFVTCAINKMAEIVRGNYKVLASKKTMATKLESNLYLLQSFAIKAERQLLSHTDTDPNLKAWLYQLKDVLCRAVDVLDSIEYKELCHRQQQGGNYYVPSSLMMLMKLIKIDDEIKELKNVLEILEAMAQKTSCFNEQLKLDTQLTMEANGQVLPAIDEPIVGLQKEMGLIVDRLLPKDITTLDSSEKTEMAKQELKILCIAGFAVVGKIALAQLVYNNQDVMHEFTLLWTFVPEITNATNVMKEILVQNGRDLPKDNQNLTSLQKELQKIVENTKFLLVLYGVQNVVTKQWKILLSALRNGQGGSAILLTTRRRQVANIVAPKESVVIVDHLEEDNCRRLFEKCATSDQNLTRNNKKKLGEIGNTICQQLHGLPSAVKILGGILKNNFDAECWKKILKGDWCEHEELAKEVLPPLLSSYRDLPSQLQQCFAYCSIFPRGYIFEKEQLVQMWIAQGYIQPERNKSMEVKGCELVDILTDRFYFREKEKGEFVMHDRVRDLAVYVSRDECFVADKISARPPPTVRHLTVNTNDPGIFNDLNYEKLRTILIYVDFDQPTIQKVIEKAKKLRVLETRSRWPTQSLTKDNCGLLHLRYLGILSTEDNHLSGSIAHLLNLQVLDLGDHNYYILPKDMNKLINLRHLYANVHTVSLISGIGNLSNLQELGNFQVGSKDGHKIKELNGLNELSGKLCISKLDRCSSKEDAQQANLIGKSHLESLQLREGIKKETLEGLLPHPNLAKLEIFDYIGTEFPNWMLECGSQFANLQSLTLKNHMSLTILPPLGQIKKLRFLILENIGLEKIGKELYGKQKQGGGAFPSLEELTLAHMSELTQWEDWSSVEGQEFFPVLIKLQILDCKYLRSIPHLSLIPSLEELSIRSCVQLSSSIRAYIDELRSLRDLVISDDPLIESPDFAEQIAPEKSHQSSSPTHGCRDRPDSPRTKATRHLVGNYAQNLGQAVSHPETLQPPVDPRLSRQVEPSESAPKRILESDSTSTPGKRTRTEY